MSDTREKIIIIGAGIIGLMSALEFLQQGYAVELYDQSDAARGASWAGGGILSTMYPWRYPDAVNALAQYGKQLYSEWNDFVITNTSIDFEIEQVGLLIFDHDQTRLAAQYLRASQDPQQHFEELTQPKLHSINSRVNQHLDHALYFPQIANVRNPRLTQSLLKYIERHPRANIHPHTKITNFVKQHGKIRSVIDQLGESHCADHYIIATGAWTQALIDLIEIDYSVKPIHGQMVLYKTPEKWLPTICMNDTMYMIPRRDGHIVCGSSMNEFGFDCQVYDEITQHIIEAATHLIPELAAFPIVKQWAGLRPGCVDGIPRIGQVPHLSNLWLNVGHHRNGLVMAPASARLLRQLLMAQTPFVSPEPYQI